MAREVDLASAFPALIDRLAGELPDARLIFNNVNDFPTWSTAAANQAAVYIEVWSPHDRLTDLARLAEQAHSFAPERSGDPRRLPGLRARRRRSRSARRASGSSSRRSFSHGATRPAPRRGARRAHRGVLRPPQRVVRRERGADTPLLRLRRPLRRPAFDRARGRRHHNAPRRRQRGGESHRTGHDLSREPCRLALG